MTPAWLLDIFAVIMLVVSAVSAARLADSWPWRSAAHPDVDIAHLLMGISMAGMLAAGLRTLPDAAWEVIFGVLTAWFAWQVVRDARAAGVRSLAGGHCAPHLVHSAAMLYMYLALVAPAASGGSGMAGMSGSGMRSLSYPTVAFLFGLVLAGYSVWDLDQVSGRRYRLVGATAALAAPGALAAPALAGVPASSGEAVASSGGGVASSGATSGAAAGGALRGLVMSPATAVSARIAMGVTMALMLFIMI
jgi:hypothetical protein